VKGQGRGLIKCSVSVRPTGNCRKPQNTSGQPVTEPRIKPGGFRIQSARHWTAMFGMQWYLTVYLTEMLFDKSKHVETNK